MGEETYISIQFDLKSPKNYRQSVLNSIVLLLQEIRSIEDFPQLKAIDIAVLNNNIDKMKIELDNLKIIEFKE